MSHPEENKIQEYLDSGNILHKDVIEGHLDICPDCRKIVEEYKELYFGLEKEEIPDLSSSFAEKVMGNIEVAQVQQESGSPWVTVLVAACFTISVGALYYFTKFKFFYSLLEIFNRQGGKLTGLADKVAGQYSIFGLSFETVSLVGIGILSIALVDYFIKFAKKRSATYMWL